jgi:glycosyltransferase involved in cell wall biosynthesis
MRVCLVAKYPPIQGGVSARAWLLAQGLTAAGHEVHVATNADEVESEYRIWRPPLAGSSPIDASGRHPVVRNLQAPDKSLRHIPRTSASVSRLAALAAQIISAAECDVVFSNYLEPYGVAAHLASRWTGTPHVLKMAGSDRVRLLAHPDLAWTYRYVMRDAAAILEEPGSLLGLGIEPARLAGSIRPIVPQELFNPAVAPVSLAELIGQAAEAGHDCGPSAPFDASVVTFGMYGKISRSKGSFDLIEALASLSRRGHEFNLVALAGGHREQEFRERVRILGLGDRVWLLPFLPYHLVPRFLRACDVVVCLERRFPIREHIPVRLRECMTVGTPVIASRELVNKEPAPSRPEHGRNAWVVEEPEDQQELQWVLGLAMMKRDETAAMGRQAASLGVSEPVAPWTAAYESVFRRVSQSPASGVRAEAPASHLLPFTAGLLGDQFDNAFATFATTVAVPGVTRVALAFAAHVMETGRDYLPGIPGWLWEYQYALAWLSLDVESEAGTPYYPPTGTLRTTLPMPGDPSFLYPVRSNYLRVMRAPLPEEIPGLRSALGARHLDPGILDRIARPEGIRSENVAGHPGPAHADGQVDALLLHKKLNFKPSIYGVSDLTVRYLAACTGCRTHTQLTEDIGASPASSRALLERLYTARMVAFALQAPARAAPEVAELPLGRPR